MKKKLKIKNDCRGMWANEIIDTIMESRGVEDVSDFINPRLDHLLPLDDLKNVDKAADIILGGVKRGDLFGIYADT